MEKTPHILCGADIFLTKKMFMYRKDETGKNFLLLL
jgi:hypothetical protein